MEKLKAPTKGNTLFVASLEKGLRVLKAFGQKQDGYNMTNLSLAEIASACNLDNSAAQRFTNTLVELGYLEKNPRTKRYRPSINLMDLSYSYLLCDPLVETAMPILIEVSRKHNTSINLGVLQGCDIIYSARIPHEKVPYAATIPGRRVPAFCTSGGIAILSHMSDDYIDSVLQVSDQKKYTDWTITETEEIRSRIKLARSNGYDLSVQQLEPGEISTAAPILDSQGIPIAAVQIPVYMPTWTVEAVSKEIAPIVVDVANTITRALRSHPKLV